MTKHSDFYKKLSNWKIREAARLYKDKNWIALFDHLEKEMPIPSRVICLTQGFDLAKARQGTVLWDDEPKSELANFNWLAILIVHLYDTKQVILFEHEIGNVSVPASVSAFHHEFFKNILGLLTRVTVVDASSVDFPNKPMFITQNGITYWLMEDGVYRTRGANRYEMPLRIG